jgi:TolB-like protein/tetratricopeptide (TPR) repeat protein
MGLLLLIARTRRSESAPETAKPVTFKSLAVLPFQLVGGSDDETYLGLGIADTLITRLSRVRQIEVRPTTAVQRYSGARDALVAGRELGVDAVLDGRIQRSGNRIRVTAQLLDARDGKSLWAGEFDENLNAIFSVQDALSAQVVRTLNLQLSGAETSRLTERGTDNPAAYQAFMRGRFFCNKRTRESLLKAVDYFREATRLDPDYAQAYAGLADSYSLLGTETARAKEAALRALQLDETLAEAHTSLANIRFFVEWNWAEAEHEFQRSIELNPNYATTHHWYAYYLAALGRMNESVSEIERARDLEPLSLIINTDAGQIYYFARQYDRAIEQLRRTVEMDPGFIMAHWRLGEAYAQSGRFEEAIAELQKLTNADDNNLTPIPLGCAYAKAGRRDEALKALRQWRQVMQRPRDTWRDTYTGYIYWMATVYAALGERDQAFHWLEKSFEQRHAEIVLLQAEPRLDSLRSDPRFADLLRRMGLEH